MKLHISILMSLTGAALASTPHVVTQFQPGTWVENIAIRPCGSFLVTTLSPSAALYHISAPTSADPNVSLIHSFTPDIATALLGIAELPSQRDVFAFVAVANISASGAASSSIFTVDMNLKPPAVKFIAPLPTPASVGGRMLPNGLAALPGDSGIVLVADSFAGLVWRVNTSSGQVDVAVKVPEMASSEAGATGVNGVKVRGDWLYFSNSWRSALYRVKIGANGSMVSGAAVMLVGGLQGLSGIGKGAIIDDFDLGENGTIYAATGDGNVLVAFTPDESVAFNEGVVVLGSAGDRTVAGGTAVSMRRVGKKHVSYVVTSGAPKQPDFAEAGKVVSFDIGNS